LECRGSKTRELDKNVPAFFDTAQESPAVHISTKIACTFPGIPENLFDPGAGKNPVSG
jgi:hypothetical protein